MFTGVTVGVVETLDALIPVLRLKIGDTNPTTYRYTDEWVKSSLIAAVIALGRWWNNKYLLDATNAVYRNVLVTTFEYTAPPVIQFKDEWIIILMASIIIKSGQLENLSWDLGSWRDAELSFSNIESGKMKDASLKKDIEELLQIIKPPLKRLVNTRRGAFPVSTTE